jgi:hypothetical protein
MATRSGENSTWISSRVQQVAHRGARLRRDVSSAATGGLIAAGRRRSANQAEAPRTAAPADEGQEGQARHHGEQQPSGAPRWPARRDSGQAVRQRTTRPPIRFAPPRDSKSAAATEMMTAGIWLDQAVTHRQD